MALSALEPQSIGPVTKDGKDLPRKEVEPPHQILSLEPTPAIDLDSLDTAASADPAEVAEQIRSRIADETMPPVVAESVSAVPESATKAPSAESTPTPVSRSVSEQRPKPLTAETLALGDLQFEAGNYRGARERYLSVLTETHSTIDVMLLLKLTLCEESLGNLTAAQNGYREILELTSEPAVRNAAIQGQARLWSASGRTELATSALTRILLEGLGRGGDSGFSHHLASIFARRVPANQHSLRHSLKLFRDENLLSPELLVNPAYIVRVATKAIERPRAASAPLRSEIQIEGEEPTSPERLLISLQMHRTSSLEILTKLIRNLGWKAHVDPEAHAALAAHTLEPDCQKVPLGIVLDCLLEPLNLIWEKREKTIHISLVSTTDEKLLQSSQFDSAFRLLQFADQMSPDHPDAVASRMELARLTAMRSSRTAAIRMLDGLIAQRSRSNYLPVAWFNLGKLLNLESRPDDAIIAFYRAADMLSGESLEVASYLFVGRILLEKDDARSAITPLTRAMSLSLGSPYEGIATLQLSSAYLMLNHFQRANNVLMEHLPALKSKEMRDPGAFLSALIHYRWAQDEHDQFRAGTNLIAAMTNIKPSDCFGGHWAWLVGSAARDIGMSQDALRIFQQSLELYSFPLQNRMRSIMIDVAPELLSRTPSGRRAVANQQAPESFQIESMLAELEGIYLQGQYDEAKRLARELLRRNSMTETQRRQTLKVMGRVLQAQGRYEESIQCFTGTIPKEVPPLPGPSAAVQVEEPVQ